MSAGVKVGIPGGMLVILLVGVFGRGAALGLDSLQIRGSKRLKLAPAGFGGIDIDCCCNAGASLLTG